MIARPSKLGAFRGVLLVLALAGIPAEALAQAPDAGNAAAKWPYAFPLIGDALALGVN